MNSEQREFEIRKLNKINLILNMMNEILDHDDINEKTWNEWVDLNKKEQEENNDKIK